MRRRHRLLRFTTCVVLTVVIGVAGVVAKSEGQDGGSPSDLATARALAFASAKVVDSRPELALRLALEACRRACATYEVRDSLLTSVQRAARLKDVFPLRGEPLAVAASPDGRRLAVSTFAPPSLVFIDLKTGMHKQTPLGEGGGSYSRPTATGSSRMTGGWPRCSMPNS